MPLIYTHKMVQNLPVTGATMVEVMSVAMLFKVLNYYCLVEISDTSKLGNRN